MPATQIRLLAIDGQPVASLHARLETIGTSDASFASILINYMTKPALAMYRQVALEVALVSKSFYI